MNDIITGKLKEIEEEENVKIIYALESGSRAWGFASPDSDYDVRFIYVRKAEDYLRLERMPDVIEWQLDEIFDVNGWDLKKALVLFQKSNPNLFEWKNSPIVYKTTPIWEKISKSVNKQFSSRAGMYHYIGTAESNYREYLTGENVRLKKYLYVLRPILACEWILKHNDVPPMDFFELVNDGFPQELRPILDKILDIKMRSPERKQIPKIAELNMYIEEKIPALKSAILNFPIKACTDWDELNALFIEAVRCCGK